MPIDIPRVYVEEISNFPPSVAQVETAIPAFIGFTEKSKDGQGKILKNKPQRITNILEYELYFGGAFAHSYSITVVENNGSKEITYSSKSAKNYFLYEAVRLYFDNGGGPCYIISIGNYTSSLNLNSFSNALNTIDTCDESTIIVFPEAVNLTMNDYGLLIQSSLTKCAKWKSKFLLTDVLSKTKVDDFRQNIGVANLKYGASYIPSFNTNYKGKVNTAKSLVLHYDQNQNKLQYHNKLLNDPSIPPAFLNEILNAIKINNMPASSAIAGIICEMDRNRGFWKAPANVCLNGIKNLTENITSQEQENLNVDPTQGKSINAIRFFTGKGNMVWGARTLDGNDNEWRYIPVRRSFQLIEKSIEKGIEFFVFEPNDANTWARIKAMIENYLTSLWRQGALQGAKPEHAFFVAIGLNITMTSLDILEGKLNVEVGLALVRPAEFIILKIQHKMQDT